MATASSALPRGSRILKNINPDDSEALDDLSSDESSDSYRRRRKEIKKGKKPLKPIRKKARSESDSDSNLSTKSDNDSMISIGSLPFTIREMDTVERKQEKKEKRD